MIRCQSTHRHPSPTLGPASPSSSRPSNVTRWKGKRYGRGVCLSWDVRLVGLEERSYYFRGSGSIIGTQGLGVSDFVYRVIALSVSVVSSIHLARTRYSICCIGMAIAEDNIPWGVHTYCFLHCNCSSFDSSLSESLRRYIAHPPLPIYVFFLLQVYIE